MESVSNYVDIFFWAVIVATVVLSLGGISVGLIHRFRSH